MPKRHRVRARARRPEPPPAPAADRTERGRGSERVRPRYRGAPPPPGGGHAIGQASPTLERAAVLERIYVVKDFGRLVKVIALVLALLVASGFVVNTLVR